MYYILSVKESQIRNQVGGCQRVALVCTESPWWEASGARRGITASADRPDCHCGTHPKRAATERRFLTIWRAEMSTGTVKWFNPTKGYGFIQPQGGGQDVFVHVSAVEKAGLTTLNEGQQVEFEIVSNRCKSSAKNLKVKMTTYKLTEHQKREARCVV
jgi:CspA family cold shock protein